MCCWEEQIDYSGWEKAKADHKELIRIEREIEMRREEIEREDREIDNDLKKIKKYTSEWALNLSKSGEQGNVEYFYISDTLDKICLSARQGHTSCNYYSFGNWFEREILVKLGYTFENEDGFCYIKWDSRSLQDSRTDIRTNTTIKDEVILQLTQNIGLKGELESLLRLEKPLTIHNKQLKYITDKI